MSWAEEACQAGEPLSIGLIANAAHVLPELVIRGVVPDVVTDQTSAHDPLYGYIPDGLSLEQAAGLRKADPEGYLRRSMDSMARHVQAMLDLQAQRQHRLRLRQQPAPARLRSGRARGLQLPRFRPGLHPSAVLRRQGPVPLGGALRRSARSPAHRRGDPGALPGGHRLASLDPDGSGEGGVPGASGAHLLARLRRTRPGRSAFQRAGAQRRSVGARSSSAATTSMPAPSPAPTVRQKG